MTEQAFVSLRGAGKSYGVFRRVPALRGVDLDVRPNERIAILGPNGAGKSTLLRLLLGILRPTRGTIAWRDGMRPPIAFAPERSRLLPRATVGEYLSLAVHSGGVERLHACVDALQIRDVLDRRTEALSKGEAQRVSLAFAFLVEAPVVVLDEPFEGLDPIIRPLARGFILSSLADGERTLITTTHRLEEVREPFDRVLVINRGRVVRDLSLTTLREIARGTVLVLPPNTSSGDIPAVLVARGLESSTEIRAVRGTFGENPAVLVGPWPANIAARDDVHPLNLETLLQLWLQPALS